MSNVNLPQIGNSGAVSIVGDESANAETLVKRDASGDTAVRRLTLAGLIGSGFIKGGKYSASTSITVDEDTYKGTLYEFDCTSGNLTCNLPAASTSTGRILAIVKTDTTANTLTADPSSTETIGPDGDTTIILTDEGECLLLMCNGTGWDILSHYSMFTGLQYSNTAASSAVAGGTSGATTGSGAAFDLTHAIQANLLRAGDVLRIRLQGTNTGGNSSDALTITLLVGTTTIIATAAFDVTDGGGDVFFIDAEIHIRTIGASGTFVASGIQGIGVPGTVTAKPFFKASTAIDTTGALTISAKALWGSSSGSNSCRLDMLSVKRLRPQM